MDCRVKLVGTLAFIIALFVVDNVWGICWQQHFWVCVSGFPGCLLNSL